MARGAVARVQLARGVVFRLLSGDRVGRRLAESHGAAFSYDEAVVAEIAGRCEEVESGARNIDHILTRTLLPELSNEFLARMAAEQSVARVHVGVGPTGQFSYVFRLSD